MFNINSYSTSVNNKRISSTVCLHNLWMPMTSQQSTKGLQHPWQKNYTCLWSSCMLTMNMSYTYLLFNSVPTMKQSVERISQVRKPQSVGFVSLQDTINSCLCDTSQQKHKNKQIVQFIKMHASCMQTMRAKLNDMTHHTRYRWFTYLSRWSTSLNLRKPHCIISCTTFCINAITELLLSM